MLTVESLESFQSDIRKEVRKVETQVRKEVRKVEKQVRQSVAGVFETAEEFVEGLRPRLHGAVNDLRDPVVTFVTTTVDSALEIRERGENLAASVQRDAAAVRSKAEGLVKKFIRA